MSSRTTRNAIRIYGNGMTAFSKQTTIGPKETLEQSIPVKEAEVWSLLGTLDFFGKGVKLSKPPAFPQSDSDSKLSISATNTFVSILTAFSGAQVNIVCTGASGAVKGTLIGVDSEQRISNGATEIRYFASIMDGTSCRRFDLNSDVSSFNFVDEADQTKLAAALKRNYQAKIEPGNTLVNFSLENTTESETTSTVEYALPGSPWASSYRLKRAGGSWTLECYAVVHNKTQFDWPNALITCVNGEPNYFITDIAEAKDVQLSRVSVVTDKARGAVDISEGYSDDLEMAGGGGSRGMAKSAARSRGIAPQSAAMSFAAPQMAGGFGGVLDPNSFCPDAQAEMSEATTSQVGDFLLMECQEEQSIPARSSALVRMYSKSLGNGSSVLYYKPQSDPKFPFRSVQFTNDTGMPLAKGVATVVIDGVNSGESVLESAKPGDTRLLAHTIESGVPITCTTKEQTYELNRVQIGDGIGYKYNRATSGASYAIRNKMDEAFTLIIEHQQIIPESDWTVKKGTTTVSQTERIPGGFRCTIELAAKESTTLTVTESRIYQQQMSLTGAELISLTSQNGFSSNTAIQSAITAQEAYDAVVREIQTLKNNRQRAQQMFDRANQALTNAQGNDQQTWATDRREAEMSIRKIDNTDMPAAETRQQTAQAALYAAFKRISLDWTPGGTQASTASTERRDEVLASTR